MKLPILSSWTYSARQSSPQLEKRKKIGLPKGVPDLSKASGLAGEIGKGKTDPPKKSNPDPSAVEAPKKSDGKDESIPVAKPDVVPNVDKSKEPSASTPKSDTMFNMDKGKDLSPSPTKLDAIPTTDKSKDVPVVSTNPKVPSSEDIGKDLPTPSPKPAVSPSIITTTIVSTVTASSAVSTFTTTMHHTESTTVKVSDNATVLIGRTSSAPTTEPTRPNTPPTESIETVKSMPSLSSNPNLIGKPSIPNPTPFPDEKAPALPKFLSTKTMTSPASTPSPPSPLPAAPKQMSPATIAAVIFGLCTLTLLGVVIFLSWKLKKRKASENMVKGPQPQTGTVIFDVDEKEMGGHSGAEGGRTVIERPGKGKWGFRRRESWER